MRERASLIGGCKGREKRLFLLLACTGFFGWMLWEYGLGLYYDSYQYIDMNIHREPVYCLFLWLLRLMFGEGGLWAAAALQTILAIGVTAGAVSFLSDEFDLSAAETGVLLFLHILPYLVTPLVSAETVALQSGILSEALCYPLFQWFMMSVYRMAAGRGRRAAALSAALALLLSLTRGQFRALFIFWLAVCGAGLFWGYLAEEKGRRQKKRLIARLAACLFATLCLFAAGSYLTKAYNYVFNEGYFVENTYGGVSGLTHVLYASDREDGEKLPVEYRDIYYQMYDSMESGGWSRDKSAKGLIGQAVFLEENHDNIKFYAIDATIMDYLVEKGVAGYIDRTLEADDIAAELAGILLWDNLPVWLMNYLLLGARGIMRCIGIVHPAVGVIVWLMFTASLVCLCGEWKKKPGSREGWLMFTALLAVLALAFSVALTIMCLSRYMIYGFSGFYTALFLLLRKRLRGRTVGR